MAKKTRTSRKAKNASRARPAKKAKPARKVKPAQKTGPTKPTGSSTPTQRRLWLMYPPKLIQEPLIWQLGHRFKVVTNIRQASVTDEIGIVCLELNGKRTVDYTENDAAIPQTGFIALQVHSGPKIEVHFKDVTIEELH